MRNKNLNLLAHELVNYLKNKNLKIAVAESCTGGLISKLITDIPTASKIFECGICSYSNEIKNKILNVSNYTLKTYGAVSKETAIEMAINIKNLANSDIGISTTGFAGPKVNNSNDQVGLVFVGFSNKLGNSYLKLNLCENFVLSREEIREIAAYNALKYVLNNLQN